MTCSRPMTARFRCWAMLLAGIAEPLRRQQLPVLVHPLYFTGGATTGDPSTRILSSLLRRDAVLFPTRFTGFF